jgi:hypothetical protein
MTEQQKKKVFFDNFNNILKKLEEMLIDISANTGHWPFQQTNCNSCVALLDRMNKYGVEKSVISNMNGIFYKDNQASNEELYSEISSINVFLTDLYHSL